MTGTAALAAAAGQSGMKRMTGTGDTKVPALRLLWRISALITFCDALFDIGYGIVKGVQRAIKDAPLAPQRRERRENGHDWDCCVCRRRGEK